MEEGKKQIDKTEQCCATKEERNCRLETEKKRTTRRQSRGNSELRRSAEEIEEGKSG